MRHCSSQSRAVLKDGVPSQFKMYLCKHFLGSMHIWVYLDNFALSSCSMNWLAGKAFPGKRSTTLQASSHFSTKHTMKIHVLAIPIPLKQQK